MQHGVVDIRPETEITAEQGYEIDRPSRILIQVNSDDDAIQGCDGRGNRYWWWRGRSVVSRMMNTPSHCIDIWARAQCREKSCERNQMNAVVFHEHGGPGKLQYQEMPMPTIGLDEVLVRVKACALNHLDI